MKSQIIIVLLRMIFFMFRIQQNSCQWLVTGRWFSPGTLISSTNKTDRHDITDILLKVTLNTIKPSNYNSSCTVYYCNYRFNTFVCAKKTFVVSTGTSFWLLDTQWYFRWWQYWYCDTTQWNTCCYININIYLNTVESRRLNLVWVVYLNKFFFKLSKL